MSEDDVSPIAIIIAWVVLLLGFFLVNAAIDQATYGDWTCMFKQCVDVKNIKEDK